MVVLVVKNLPANAEDLREAGLIPGSGKSPGGGNVNPLQYSYLENPVDRGAWWATVHGVIESETTEQAHCLFLFFRYLFIWLCWVLNVALRISHSSL